MTNSKSTKRALFTSVLALLMCVTMLIGATFAWFTDTASTGVNKIQAGNLDIELAYKNSTTGGKFKEANKETPVFDNNALWEPGHVEYVVLKVSNAGSLALKYKLGINIASETGSTNVDGKAFKLSDYIRFAVLDGDRTGDSVDRDALVAAATDSKLIKEGYTAENHLTATGADNSQKVVTLVVWMPTTVGNEANHKKDATAPSIDLGISVVATQYTHENDSFDNQYDKDAQYPPKTISVTTAEEFTAALKDAKAGDTVKLAASVTGSSAFTVNKELTIDLNGYTLNSTNKNTLKLASGAELTMKDSSADQSGKLSNGYVGKADVTMIDLGAQAKFTLLSGTLEGNEKDNLYSIVIGNSAKKECTVTIAGGTVTVPERQTKSRAISASNGMTLNISGGQIIGGLYGLDLYTGSHATVTGGRILANAKDGRTDEYGTSYAVHAKGEATLTVGSLSVESRPEIKGIKFESSGVKTELPTITLVKGDITNPVYSMEAKYNYSLFKLGITADAPVTFVDDTAHYFLADGLQMVQNGSTWSVAAQ